MVDTALDVTLREPRESDWPAILALAIADAVRHDAADGEVDRQSIHADFPG